jgi:hypothetical protein
MKTNLLVSTLIATVVSTGAMAQNACQQDVSNVKVVIRGIPVKSAPTYYDDILQRCENFVSSLKYEQKIAAVAAAGSGFDAGVVKLARALAKLAVPPMGSNTPYPMTVSAVWTAKKIASAVLAATAKTSQDGNILQQASSQTRWSVLNQSVNVVIKAFEKYDRANFKALMESVYDDCDGECYERDTIRETSFRGTKDLAQDILKLQQRLAPDEMTDTVELNIAKAVVDGAKDVLASSPMRRDFGYSIRDLHRLGLEIGRDLTCSSGTPARWQIPTVRKQIRDATAGIGSCERRNADEEIGFEQLTFGYDQ